MPILHKVHVPSHPQACHHYHSQCNSILKSSGNIILVSFHRFCFIKLNCLIDEKWSLFPLLSGSTTASTFMESILLVGVPGKALICLNEWPFSFSGSVCPIWQYCNYNIGSFRKTAKFGISLLLPLNIMQASRITNNECSTSKPFVIVPLLLFSWLVQMTFGQIMLTGQSLLNSMILGHQ